MSRCCGKGRALCKKFVLFVGWYIHLKSEKNSKVLGDNLMYRHNQAIGGAKEALNWCSYCLTLLCNNKRLASPSSFFKIWDWHPLKTAVTEFENLIPLGKLFYLFRQVCYNYYLCVKGSNLYVNLFRQWHPLSNDTIEGMRSCS